MANSLTTIQIAAVYSLINNGTLAKIEKGSDRYAVIKALRVMKPIAEEYETNRMEAIKRLCEGHDEERILLDRLNRRDQSLTQDEITKAGVFAEQLNIGINNCLKDILEKEHTLNIEQITEAALIGLLEGNNWRTSDCMLIEEALCNI